MASVMISISSVKSIPGVYRQVARLCSGSLHGLMFSQVFYFGYLTGAFISGRALQYFHAGKVIGCAYFLWGCTLLGCIGVKNFQTLMALRFLLG